MKRRRSREYALQILFQLELTGNKLSNEVLDEFWESIKEDDEVKQFTYDIVSSTLANLETIDRVIQKAAEHWAIERMAAIDRNILRAATNEILYRSDIPSSVAINEALEIAKKYSTEDSAPFINGILDRIAEEGIHPSSSSKE
ncbi:MAG: transcription antitermination factor NusB [Nitrospiraceae bacterium]|jgi:N utilization substance protein B|nr:MAG: transcription antitermination factor NusB [Nitrospiraceae bacterium]